MKHIQRQQFSFTTTSIKVSPKILVYVFHFVSQLPSVCFFKDELEARKSLKAFFYSQNYNEIFFGKFSFIRGKKMTKCFLKFYKLIIKPDTRSGRCLKSYNSIKNVHKLNKFNFFKQGPAYKKEGPDPNKGSNQQ